jgi:uncharacterized membrane protein (TIGR02234 family)
MTHPPNNSDPAPDADLAPDSGPIADLGPAAVAPADGAARSDSAAPSDGGAAAVGLAQNADASRDAAASNDGSAKRDVPVPPDVALPHDQPRRSMAPGRSFVYALLLGIAGAALTLYAASRTWSLQVIVRPGLPDLRTARTGATEFPLLIGLALVGLAGAGALLATRGLTRRILGGLLAAVGAGLILESITGRIGLNAGRAGTAATIWSIACIVGGAMIVLGGLAAATQGHRWPTMGARYERRTVPPPATDPGANSRPLATTGPNRGETPKPHPNEPNPAESADAQSGAESADAQSAAESANAQSAAARSTDAQSASATPVDTRAVWDALDRGDDPTAR